MANNKLFLSATTKTPAANTRNVAGGAAYALTPKHALAQLAATGCFSGTFYGSAQAQLDQLRGLIDQVDDNVYLAKLAVYARERAYMKDMPAALLLSLAQRDTKLLHTVFDRVVDNGRVLRTVFQMLRSGQFGRRGMSASLQRAFQRWLNAASVSKLLAASVGNDPSLRDILRLARPTPADNARRALYGWLTSKAELKWAPATAADLPPLVRALVEYRAAETEMAQLAALRSLTEKDQKIRWDLLADAVRSPRVWTKIARQMGPQALRMNLNTLLRHDVLQDRNLVNWIAARLASPNEIRQSRQFPYQYLAAYLNVAAEVPQKIKAALHSAAEIACGNVPQLPGPVVIGLDTSGSMSSPATGNRGRGATSKMRCIDVAALFAAAILRRNPDSVVIPFDTQAYEAKIDPSDSILSLAERLAKYGGGGTDCSLPLRTANTKYHQRKFVGCVLVSDNASWVTAGQAYGTGYSGGTGVMTEWQTFEDRQRRRGTKTPKLICIDIQSYGTTQALERQDILNIGGFSDAVFNTVAAFLTNDASRFVTEVESVRL